MELPIANFCSYFSIFVIANLGYATSDAFREAVDDDILKIDDAINSISTKIKILKAKTYLQSSSDKNPSEVLDHKLDEYWNKLNVESAEAKVEILKRGEFVNGFKCMFLLT